MLRARLKLERRSEGVRDEHDDNDKAADGYEDEGNGDDNKDEGTIMDSNLHSQVCTLSIILDYANPRKNSNRQLAIR